MGREHSSYLDHGYLTAHMCKDFQMLVCVEMHVSLVKVRNSRKNGFVQNLESPKLLVVVLYIRVKHGLKWRALSWLLLGLGREMVLAFSASFPRAS